MALLAGGSWNGNVMSAFSVNRRRILSLWLPRLPIDRIKRELWRNVAAPARAFSGESLPRTRSGVVPVRVKKTRQIKNPEPRFDSIETEEALASQFPEEG